MLESWVSTTHRRAESGKQVMADKTMEREPGKLSLTKGKLGLSKGGDAGKIKQSFSHGRSKTVTVEVKRKRGPGTEGVKLGKGARDVGALVPRARGDRGPGTCSVSSTGGGGRPRSRAEARDVPECLAG